MGLDMYLYEKTTGQEVGYWRKANQIHNWFVNNIQNGEDECGEYDVPYEKLLELRGLCYDVLKTKNPSLLPPTSGFFFGSTEINDHYYDDLRDTIKIIEALNDADKYTYHSSW